jgi:regulator of RNase E activity RraA
VAFYLTLVLFRLVVFFSCSPLIILFLVPFAPKSPLAGLLEEQPKVIAPASTVKYVGKSEDVASKDSPYSVPSGSHYVDMTEPGTVVVIEQPDGQTCAVLGGIMATRMRLRGAKAIVVGGRVRDLAELRENGLPVSIAIQAVQLNC